MDIRNIALGSYVKNAQHIINQNIKLPPGYSITWSGQYEYLLRAKERLSQVIPLTLLIIFLLLYLTFRRISEVFLVMATLPFALVGGFWFVYFLDYHMSVAIAVGFIALADVATEFGVIMLVYLDNAVKHRLSNNSLVTQQDLIDTIIEGAVMRIRPKVMTVAVIMARLIPIKLNKCSEYQSTC